MKKTNQFMMNSVLIFILVIFVTSSFAASAVKVFDTEGRPRGLSINADGNIIMTTDPVDPATAFQTDIIQRDTVSLSGSESTVTIAADVTSIILHKITGTVTMFVNSSSNLAEIYQITSDDYFSVSYGISEYDTSLILIGSGTVEVEQRRRAPSFN